MPSSAQPLIARLLPCCSLREVDRVAVAADPERAYAVARALDMYRVAFVRRLFELRLLPERVAARLRGKAYGAPPKMRIDDIAGEGPGFIVLREEPGREVVVGAVGKFWQPAIEFAAVTPEQFTAFDRPGYGKLAWCIRVDPRAGGGSWLTVEVRVGATDDASLRRFERYWSVIGRFSRAIRHGVLRLLVQELGAAPADASRALPSDDMLPGARLQRTHATTIDAPPDRVWPWLLQMGAGRAGWYSFDFLDNGRVPSADRIIPSLQSLCVGDIVPALPHRPGGFAVLALDPGRSLVLGDPSLAPGGTGDPGAPPWRTTWAFVLEPIGGDATRLLVRVRADYAPALTMVIARPVMTLAHEVMERRQLRNLRRRAEAMAAPRA